MRHMCCQKTEAGVSDHRLWQERGHAGCLVALLQTPLLADVVLSVGDWTWALWLLGGPKVPLLTSPPSPVLYTCATWSCTRPGEDCPSPLLAWTAGSGDIQQTDLEGWRAASKAIVLGRQLQLVRACCSYRPPSATLVWLCGKAGRAGHDGHELLLNHGPHV